MGLCCMLEFGLFYAGCKRCGNVLETMTNMCIMVIEIDEGQVDAIRTNRNIEYKWHKLDNTANIFPVISSKNFSSVYRVSVRLSQDVDSGILQKALDDTLPLFDCFRVRLRHGLFWYYFETNKKTPLIGEENPIPCRYFAPSTNNQFLFKVYYFKKRISLEVFHAITDGTGALSFLKELTCCYIRLANQGVFKDDKTSCPCVETTTNLEDSYLKNFSKQKNSGYSTVHAYQIKGEKLPLYLVGVIHGYLNTKQLLDLCHQKNATMTQYLATVIIWSIYKECLNGQPDSHPVQISIPVNLRPIFDSTTSMNFFSVFFAGLHVERNDYTFEEILEITKDQFKTQLTKENFSKKIAFNVSTGKNIFVRFLPLPLKNISVKIGYWLSSRANTFSFSNLGRIEVPEQYKEYIDNFEILMTATNAEPVKCSLCTFGEKTVVTFTSRLNHTYVQKAFFRKLSSDGLDIVIESNGVNDENL